jgi:hypothetical protein
MGANRKYLLSYWMVFDVESVGLHGEGFAVGYAVIDANCRCEPRSGEGGSGFRFARRAPPGSQ